MTEKKIRIVCNFLNKKYEIFHIRYKENDTIALDPLFQTKGNDEKQLLNLKSFHWTLHNKRDNQKTTFYSSTKGTFTENGFSFNGKKHKIKIDERFRDIPKGLQPQYYDWTFKNFKGRFPLRGGGTFYLRKEFIPQEGMEKIEFTVNDKFKNLNLRIFLSDKDNIDFLEKKITKFKFNQTKIFNDYFPFLVLQLYAKD